MVTGRMADRVSEDALDAPDLSIGLSLEDLRELNSPARGRFAVAAEDGSFTVTNLGNGFSKHYAARQ